MASISDLLHKVAQLTHLTHNVAKDPKQQYVEYLQSYGKKGSLPPMPPVEYTEPTGHGRGLPVPPGFDNTNDGFVRNPDGSYTKGNFSYRVIDSTPDLTITPQPSTLGVATNPNLDAIVQQVRDYYSNKRPRSEQNKPLETYYPIAPYLDQLVRQGEQIRPGLGRMAALQAFYESTGGRGTSNLFGVLPGGEGVRGNDFLKQYPIPRQIDYLYGPSVLAGGVGGRLNLITGKTGSVTPEEIKSVYQAYDPHGAYVNPLVEDYNVLLGR